jgi:hypothetical protein
MRQLAVLAWGFAKPIFRLLTVTAAPELQGVRPVGITQTHVSVWFFFDGEVSAEDIDAGAFLLYGPRTDEQRFYFDGHRARERGFTGVCRFTVKPAKTAPQHRHIHGTLARYSFYAGTGRKTTMGMGVTGFMGSEQG